MQVHSERKNNMEFLIKTDLSAMPEKIKIKIKMKTKTKIKIKIKIKIKTKTKIKIKILKNLKK